MKYFAVVILMISSQLVSAASKKEPVVIKNDVFQVEVVQVKDRGKISTQNYTYLPYKGGKFIYIVGYVSNLSNEEQVFRFYHLFLTLDNGVELKNSYSVYKWSEMTGARYKLKPGEKHKFYMGFPVDKGVQEFDIYFYKVGSARLVANQIPREIVTESEEEY